MAYVSHALIAPDAIARRDYQVAIAAECAKRNTLVILPTGMGKTVVALLAMAHRAALKPGKILFLAPTKPLVEQHARFVQSYFLRAPAHVMTGETSPEERELLWREAAVVCSTPQVVQNDLISGRIDLRDTTLVIFDEAHRAVGSYAYSFIAERYRDERADGLILGMTASPGANADKIREVCQALGIEGVEVRTEFDADTSPYVQDTQVEWKPVVVPENLKRIGQLFQEMLDERMKALRQTGAYKLPYVSKKELLALAGRIQGALRQGPGENASAMYAALSLQAAALKINHALELAETQGAGALENYLERLAADESKAAKAILADPRLREVRDLLDRRTAEHPKLRQVAVTLRQQLAENPESRMIVFTNYRDTAELLTRELAKVDGIKPVRFVGQASRSERDQGLSQKQQVDIIERFKAGEFNTLVATSVAEEGLDIPATDLVIFFEPVPSEIRAIQRRGRTGRQSEGRVVILIAKGSKDETYHWASRGKEKKMRKEIDALKQIFSKVNASESSSDWKEWFTPASAGKERKLTDFAPAAVADAPAPEARERAVVVTDHREFNSAVVRELARLDVIVKAEQLLVGDYVLSDRLAVERKETHDFATSLIDGRLFPQARALRDAYTAAVIIIEGEDLLTARKLAPEMIYGAIASLVADYRVTVLQTKDARETAMLLATLAKREQLGEKRAVALRAGKGPMTEEEQMRYVLEGLPGVSAVLARRLLEAFGTVRAVANASLADLMEVEGIGEKIAGEIHRVLNATYTGKPR